MIFPFVILKTCLWVDRKDFITTETETNLNICSALFQYCSHILFSVHTPQLTAICIFLDSELDERAG